MKRPAVHAASGRPANDHGRGGIPKIMSLGDEIRNLIERADDEVDELHFANGAHAAVDPDVFADQNDRRVPLHLLKHGLLDGFEKSNLGSARLAAIRSGPVCLGHGYLRAFLEALAAPAFTVFFGAAFAAIFAAGFPPFAEFVSFPTSRAAGCVSPK